MSLPKNFLSRLPEIVSPSRLNSVLNSFSRAKNTSLRVNTLKTSSADLVAYLSRQNILLTPVSWSPSAFVCAKNSGRELTETDPFKSGGFYLQNLSSQLPALILNPNGSDYVLDIAAAPGSKTSQMAALMDNSGKILAVDISRVRLYQFKTVLERLGVTNTKIFLGPGQIIGRKFTETFTKVLVDVPCSMEGLFLEYEPKSYSHWSVKKVKSLSDRQRQLLTSAFYSLKSGDTLVYSTCTLAPEENEGVIDWFINRFTDFARLLPVSLPGLNFSPALTHWENKVYSDRISDCVRLLPDENYEAFFIAHIQKTAPIRE